MQKLPTFHSAKHEFTYFATLAMKNAMAVQTIENHLNIVAERVNEIIDRDSSIDLEAFKANFLSELETALAQNTVLDDLTLEDNFNLLEIQFEALTQRVAKIESALEREKIEG